MNAPAEGDVVTIGMSGGRTVTMRVPAEEVTAALVRSRDAIRAGRHPTPGDIALVMAWLDEDEKEFPTEGI